jgi:predicted ester cyclase
MTATLPNKQLVWAYWNQLVGANKANLRDILAQYNAPDVDWSGGHPINDLPGVDALASGFWEPLLHAVPDLVRRTDILMGNTWGGYDFVTGTGYFIGTFVNDWLGIPATGKTIYIRFGAFHRIEYDKITQTRILFDLPDVMRQVGFQVLAPSLGDERIVPGPAAGDGLLFREPNLAETVKTQTLVEAMVRGLQAYDGKLLESQGMPAFWTEDMTWYGPLGHGTYYTLHDFIYVYEDHFFTGLQPTQFGGVARIAFFSDGLYSTVCGWPSIRAVQGGGYLGAPASGKEIEMRVMDWWRRKDDLLDENWVFIDVPHVFKQLGIDVFERMTQSSKTKA